ncbi:hypothetical protein [Candidatus Regiella insecticola]|nr:hypothetical protein [Candidatus Regiella insecticola]
MRWLISSTAAASTIQTPQIIVATCTGSKRQAQRAGCQLASKIGDSS